MAKSFNTSTIDTIISGARLMAVNSDMDPDIMEGMIRKAARIARENLLQDVRAFRANDK